MRARIAVPLVLIAFAAAGCSSGVGTVAAPGDKAAGKALFISTCSSCHTLAEAKASGKVGPNLDDAFGSDRAQGFKESTIRQVVADQIRFPGNYGPTGPTMPKNLVKGKAVDDVASYVAYVAGIKGVSVSASTTPASTTPAPSGGGGTAAGKSAFIANGCGACHTLTAAGTTGTIGPDLDKLKSYAAVAKMPLNAFILESIVSPNAYIQPGYQPSIMPETFKSLPKSTLDALVMFLAASAKS
ncbi:MAG: c-type cytochrome [Gaiellaceae bacterium]